MAIHNERGEYGEKIAMAHLREKGYVILEMNWRSNHLEIDIIAAKDNKIVFVEVKTRRNTEYSTPTSSVDRKKINNIVRAANSYIIQKDTELEPRFDIITVVGDKEPFKIEHIEEAFFPPMTHR